MYSQIFKDRVIDYNKIFSERSYSELSDQAQKVADKYYTLVTEFYEKGWGESFHFAPRFRGEDFRASIVRHEHFMALKLGLSASDTALDVGCGVMGPARNLARISGAQITGLTINKHQVQRCIALNKASTVGHLLSVVEGDFMDMPFDDNTFDKIYAIDATCHASDLSGVYKQCLRKLKPGGRACFYEWAMTDRYDPANAAHNRIKEMIEYGNGICALRTTAEIDKAVEEAGFVKEDAIDMSHTDFGNDVPWYSTLQSGWSLSQMRHSKVVRIILQNSLRVMELLRIVPQGTSDTHRILLTAADGLPAGGKTGIFTPMYLVVVSKPL